MATHMPYSLSSPATYMPKVQRNEENFLQIKNWCACVFPYHQAFVGMRACSCHLDDYVGLKLDVLFIGAAV